MPLIVVGASHHVFGVDELGNLAGLADQVSATLFGLDGVRGHLVLSTCNRFEVYVDSQRFHDPVEAVTRLVAESIGEDIAEVLSVQVGDDAVRHAMAVTAGLDSMVVGEAEIAGQVRAAMRSAALSPKLRRLFQHSLTTSKALASGTELGAAGRTLAGVALDVVARELGDLAACRALLVGTGAYAGIVVAELARRGVSEILVHSPTSRAGRFAQSHPAAKALPGHQLADALAEVDVVVCCSATGRTVLVPADLTTRDPQRPLSIVDLTAGRGVDPTVEQRPGVRLLDLDAIGAMVAGAGLDCLGRAWDVVDRAVATYLHMEEGRAADPAVIAIRTHISRIIEAELVDVTQRCTPEVAQVVARSLRRVSNELLHTPSIRAHEMARTGDLDDYRRAMSTLFGIELQPCASDVETADWADPAQSMVGAGGAGRP